MEREKAITNMLGAGLSSFAAEQALAAGFTLTSLRNSRKKDLTQALGEWVGKEIHQALKRDPIPQDVVDQLVTACEWSCCLCWNLDARGPVILHHIDEHATGGKDTFDNLIVLCLDHHALAHSRWDISRHPAPKELLRTRKDLFIAAIEEFRAGHRAAPGREGDSSDLMSQPDITVLRQLSAFLDRPAVFRPISVEGNMRDFLVAMEDVIRALNTGILQTREGKELGRTRGIRTFSNPHWEERLLLVRDQFDIVRARVETAIRSGQIIMHSDGSYEFRNMRVADEIDLLRTAPVTVLNGVLEEAGLQPVKLPQRDFY